MLDLVVKKIIHMKMGKKLKYEGCRNRTHQGGSDEFKPSNKLITMPLAEPRKLKNDM